MPARKTTAKKTRGKKKTGATRNSERKSSFVNWMILIVLIGILVTFLVYLDRMPSSEDENHQADMTLEAQPDRQKKQSIQAEKRPPEQQFDFYTVLPDREIDVDIYEEDDIPSVQIKKSKTQKQSTTQTQQESPAAAVTPPAEKKTKSASGGLYQLQVGAFKELAKADAMKARLAFMGVESNIYVVRSGSGEKIYRVRVGPNSDEKKLSRIQQQLKAENINTFMQKLKG